MLLNSLRKKQEYLNKTPNTLDSLLSLSTHILFILFYIGSWYSIKTKTVFILKGCDGIVTI